MKTFIRHDYKTLENAQQVESIIRTADGKIVRSKGVTHVMVVEGNRVYYANAICSCADNFSKSAGRAVALNRINELKRKDVYGLALPYSIDDSTLDVKAMLKLKAMFHKTCDSSYKTITYLESRAGERNPNV